ncbi:MAG: ABC transporter permease [Rhodocyclaceae bacterium]|nr:ABC transporter permease [Rhodocyclaceae bacterium]
MPFPSFALTLSDFALAARNVRRHTRRTLFALSIIVGGVTAFMLAGGFIDWVLYGMREAAIQSQLGHIQITRPDYFEKGIGDPYNYLLPDPGSEPFLASQPNIVSVAPRLAFGGLVSRDEETIAFIGEGIDPVKEAPMTKALEVVAGRDLASIDEQSILMGEGLAANIGAEVGDVIVLLANTAAGNLNAVEVTIVGLFTSASKAYDDTALRAPLPIARDLMRVEGATSWVVLLDDTALAPKAVESFRQALDAGQYEITPWWALADFYNKTVELFSKQVMLLRILVGAIVVLSISNTLSMAVAERTSEIGTSMALGVRRARILRLFVSEGAVLGIIGGIVGALLAWGLGEAISHVGIPMPPPPGMTRGYVAEILISPGLAADGFLLAFVTTLLASILPATRAARLNVVDALRH